MRYMIDLLVDCAGAAHPSPKRAGLVYFMYAVKDAAGKLGMTQPPIDLMQSNATANIPNAGAISSVG